jgi:hypothetical protein
MRIIVLTVLLAAGLITTSQYGKAQTIEVDQLGAGIMNRAEAARLCRAPEWLEKRLAALAAQIEQDRTELAASHPELSEEVAKAAASNLMILNNFWQKAAVNCELPK